MNVRTAVPVAPSMTLRASASSDGRLARLLSQSGADDAALREGVESATDDELLAFGLRAYRLNLLSLFGSSWSREKIFATARRAAISKILGGWEHHHRYLPGLGAVADRQRLRGTPSDHVAHLQAQGRGLVVMSFHLGHMRQIATDLVHAGISICAPLAFDAFNNYRTAQIANPSAALWKGLRVVNVEERAGTFALARALAAGTCVFSTIDGNTGLDGPHGNQRRTQVPLLEARARVKTGLFDMAARFGVPLLVVVSHTEGAERVCSAAPVIDPGGPLGGEAAERFVADAIGEAYAFFAETLRDHADEWCGGDLFHQWKVPDRRPPQDLRAVDRTLGTWLAEGGSLIADRRRILPLDGERGLVWSDAVSGKCYQLPEAMSLLVARLLDQDAGIDLQWSACLPEDIRAMSWNHICYLAARGAIIVNGDTATSQ